MREQWKETLQLVLDPTGLNNINKARDQLEKARVAFEEIDCLMNKPVSVKVLVEMYGQFQAALTMLDVGIDTVETLQANMTFKIALPEPEPAPEEQLTLEALKIKAEVIESGGCTNGMGLDKPKPEPEPEPAPQIVFKGNDYRWLGRRQQALLEALVLRERSTGAVVELSYLLETLHERKIVRGKAEFGRILKRLTEKNLVYYDATHIHFTGE